MSSTMTATFPLTSPIKFITYAMTPAGNHKNVTAAIHFISLPSQLSKTKKTSIKKGNYDSIFGKIINSDIYSDQAVYFCSLI